MKSLGFEACEGSGRPSIRPWHPWEKQFEPEGDLLAIAEHDFSGLSMPILIACHDQEQFDEFVFREGLMCSEVRRFQPGRCNPDCFPRNKVLILLPYWHDHASTRKLVENWVNREDRYTVELKSPLPVVKKRGLFVMSILCLIAWAVLFWLVFRGEVSSF